MPLEDCLNVKQSSVSLLPSNLQIYLDSVMTQTLEEYKYTQPGEERVAEDVEIQPGLPALPIKSCAPPTFWNVTYMFQESRPCLHQKIFR